MPVIKSNTPDLSIETNTSVDTNYGYREMYERYWDSFRMNEKFQNVRMSGNHQSTSNADAINYYNIDSETFRIDLIRRRMRGALSPMPFTYMATAITGDVVFVFIVHKGEAVTLKDTATLFPSDTLITQIGLLA